MEIKYEAVFGPQHLFKLPSAEIIVVGPHGDKTESNIDLMIGNTPDDYVIVAMRRIIRTPTWSVADQKAGRLPEVGAKCRQGHKDEIVVAVTEKFVVTECQDMSVCTTRKDVFMRSYNPIETPEEKAQREEDEFVSLVEFEYNKMPNEISFKAGIRAAYRKLKGGE